MTVSSERDLFEWKRRRKSEKYYLNFLHVEKVNAFATHRYGVQISFKLIKNYEKQYRKVEKIFWENVYEKTIQSSEVISSKKKI